MPTEATTPSFPRIASIYGAGIGPDATEVELRLAARYDLLIGGLRVPPETHEIPRLNDKLGRLRELNPEIVVLHFAGSAPYWIPDDAGLPESAYLHTTEGERVAGWPGTQMLNLSRPEAVDALTRAVVERSAPLALDGVFVDCMIAGFDWWTVEIESGKEVAIDADGDGRPDEGAALDAAWTEGKRALLEQLRRQLGEQAIIMVNAQMGREYALPYINGNYYEDYVDYAIDERMRWAKVLKLYLDDCALPHTPTCTTINASTGIWPEYNAPQRLPYDECCDLLEQGYAHLRRMRFGLTTALMGDGYYGFDLNTRWRGQHWWYAEFDAPLGQALGPAEEAGDGTWRRSFEGGLVVVNPVPRRVHLEFDRRHRDYTTGWVGKQAVIPARDGRIYVPVG